MYPNHTDTLLCHCGAVRCPITLHWKGHNDHGNDQSSHLIRLYGAAPRRADADGAPDGDPALVLQRVRLHPARHAHHRSGRSAFRSRWRSTLPCIMPTSPSRSAASRSARSTAASARSAAASASSIRRISTSSAMANSTSRTTPRSPPSSTQSSPVWASSASRSASTTAAS